MPSFVVANPLSVDYVEPRGRVAEFIATPISWYTTRFSTRRDDSQGGYFGQDESALLYLHLPRGNRVNFNLNRIHPKDEFQLESYADDCELAKLLTWIENMSHCHEKRYTPKFNICPLFSN